MVGHDSVNIPKQSLCCNDEYFIVVLYHSHKSLTEYYIHLQCGIGNIEKIFIYVYLLSNL